MIFLGRGEIGYQVLQDLLRNPNVEVPFIATCPHSAEVGRSEEAFREIAQARNIPFYATASINRPEWTRILTDARADVAVAMLWVNIIKQEAIRTTRLGFLNLHGGLLPRYRGNACSNWALLNGECEQGVSVHLMESGKLDSGPILLQERILITPQTTIGELVDTITRRGIRMVAEAVEGLRTGAIRGVDQDHEQALHCYPRLPRDGEIDWKRSAENIFALVRASGRPYPGAYTYFADHRDNDRIKKMVIWSASTEDHPTRSCAVPGHVLRLDDGQRWAVECGDNRLLILKDIEIDGQVIAPSAFFKTVRQRLGLDTAALLQEIARSRAQLEQAREGLD